MRAGVVTGAGKQLHGALINVLSFYAAAMPAALLLGFATPLNVYGLYTGISLGPLIQAVLYGALLLRVDWEKEALVAARRAQEDDS